MEEEGGTLIITNVLLIVVIRAGRWRLAFPCCSAECRIQPLPACLAGESDRWLLTTFRHTSTPPREAPNPDRQSWKPRRRSCGNACWPGCSSQSFTRVLDKTGNLLRRPRCRMPRPRFRRPCNCALVRPSREVCPNRLPRPRIRRRPKAIKRRRRSCFGKPISSASRPTNRKLPDTTKKAANPPHGGRGTSASTTVPHQMIIADLQMLEFSWTKLDQLGSERYGGSKDMTVLALLTKLQGPSGKPGETAPADPKLRSLVEALRKDGLLEIIATPLVKTLCDLPAYVNVGGHIGYQEKDSEGKEETKFLEYGLRLDLVPHITSGDRIHIDFPLRKSELDNAHSVRVGGQEIPGLISREVETSVDLRSGETIAVNGGVRQEVSSRYASRAVAGARRREKPSPGSSSIHRGHPDAGAGEGGDHRAKNTADAHQGTAQNRSDEFRPFNGFFADMFDGGAHQEPKPVAAPALQR